ncbi:GNAT family N-acetyltransferase [Planctomycetota bacterium]|nr:GNAT family N-acetyltransferase [Planctomycetota bacterium]
MREGEEEQGMIGLASEESDGCALISDGGGDGGGAAMGEGDGDGDGDDGRERKMWLEVMEQRFYGGGRGEGAGGILLYVCEVYVEGIDVSVGRVSLRMVKGRGERGKRVSEEMGDVECGGVMNDLLRFGGHLGYRIWEPYRGKGFGTRAVRMGVRVLSNYGLDEVLIVTGIDNDSSKRVIDKVGGEFVEVVKLVGCKGLGDEEGKVDEDDEMGLWRVKC